MEAKRKLSLVSSIVLHETRCQDKTCSHNIHFVAKIGKILIHLIIPLLKTEISQIKKMNCIASEKIPHVMGVVEEWWRQLWLYKANKLSWRKIVWGVFQKLSLYKLTFKNSNLYFTSCWTTFSFNKISTRMMGTLSFTSSLSDSATTSLMLLIFVSSSWSFFNCKYWHS